MSSNDSFFQGKKPAAVLKHAVLAEYLSVFCSMVGSRRPGPIWLIDGYAGPGAYADGADTEVSGSPLVALHIAEKAAHQKSPRTIRCAFIEQDAGHYSQLQANVRQFEDRGATPLLLHGEVQQQLPSAWSAVGMSPVLTMLDPFGVSMAKDLMTSLLLKRVTPPSEVLVNINVEAISRHGGYLESGANGTPRIKPGLPHQGVEKADQFLGGTWWRTRFLDERARTGSAAEAASAVVNDYRSAIHRETGVKSISVPIRRRATRPPLFLLNLFYRHDAAGYKFADAAARASRKWRDVYRRRDLEDFFEKQGDQGMLPSMDNYFRADSDSQAMQAEKELEAANIAAVVQNIRSLLAVAPQMQVGRNVVDILGSSLSLAGDSTIRKAWDQLADAHDVGPRDKSQDLWKQTIVRL